jgi:hypothetical protein
VSILLRGGTSGPFPVQMSIGSVYLGIDQRCAGMGVIAETR